MGRTCGVRIYTPAEAAGAVLADFDAFRDRLRAMANTARRDGDGNAFTALVVVAEQFDVLEDRVLARFDRPPRNIPLMPAGEPAGAP